MLHIGRKKNVITNKLLVYIHITVKQGHEISMNLSIPICEHFMNLGIFSKTHHEILCFFLQIRLVHINHWLNY